MLEQYVYCSDNFVETQLVHREKDSSSCFLVLVQTSTPLIDDVQPYQTVAFQDKNKIK